MISVQSRLGLGSPRPISTGRLLEEGGLEAVLDKVTPQLCIHRSPTPDLALSMPHPAPHTGAVSRRTAYLALRCLAVRPSRSRAALRRARGWGVGAARANCAFTASWE